MAGALSRRDEITFDGDAEVRLRLELGQEDIARVVAAMNEGLAASRLDAHVAAVGPSSGGRTADRKRGAVLEIEQARARGEARLVKWTEDGTLIPGHVLQDVWSIRRQSLDAARERSELFSIKVKGVHWYPRAFLRFERKDLARIVGALGAADATSKLLFFLKEHGPLGGNAPDAAVAAGRLDDVIRIAEYWAVDAQ